MPKMRLNQKYQELTFSGFDIAAGSLTTVVSIYFAYRISGDSGIGELTLIGSVVLLFIGFFRLVVSMPYYSHSKNHERHIAFLPINISILLTITLAGLGALLFLLSQNIFILVAALWSAASIMWEGFRTVSIARHRYGLLATLSVSGLVAFSFIGFFLSSILSIAATLIALVVAMTFVGLLALKKISLTGLRKTFKNWREELAQSSIPLIADGIIYTVGSQLMIWILANKAGISVVGQLRLIMLLASPILLFQTAFSNWFITHLGAATGARSVRLVRNWIYRLAPTFAIISLLIFLLAIAMESHSWSTQTFTALALILIVNSLMGIYGILYIKAVLDFNIIVVAWARVIWALTLAALMSFTALSQTTLGASLALLISTVFFCMLGWRAGITKTR